MNERAADVPGETPDEITQERIARNDATFRAANERIREAAEEYEIAERVPFFCECADPECRRIVQVSLDEYEAVRRDSRHFINEPGHEAAAQGAAVVVSANDRYVVVEKIERAGDVSEELDERDRV